jgi:hypothetical protein
MLMLPGWLASRFASLAFITALVDCRSPPSIRYKEIMAVIIAIKESSMITTIFMGTSSFRFSVYGSKFQVGTLF